MKKKKTWKNNKQKNMKTPETVKQMKEHGVKKSRDTKKQQKTKSTRKHVEMWVAIDDFSEPYSKTCIA